MNIDALIVSIVEIGRYSPENYALTKIRELVQSAIEEAVAAERSEILSVIRQHDTGDGQREDREARRIIARLEARSSKP